MCECVCGRRGKERSLHQGHHYTPHTAHINIITMSASVFPLYQNDDGHLCDLWHFTTRNWTWLCYRLNKRERKTTLQTDLGRERERPHPLYRMTQYFLLTDI